jgi:hypothetical protein
MLAPGIMQRGGQKNVTQKAKENVVSNLNPESAVTLIFIFMKIYVGKEGSQKN